VEGEKGWYWKSTVEMLFGMVQGGEGGENERCEMNNMHEPTKRLAG